MGCGWLWSLWLSAHLGAVAGAALYDRLPRADAVRHEARRQLESAARAASEGAHERWNHVGDVQKAVSDLPAR